MEATASGHEAEQGEAGDAGAARERPIDDNNASEDGRSKL